VTKRRPLIFPGITEILKHSDFKFLSLIMLFYYFLLVISQFSLLHRQLFFLLSPWLLL
jgi:hypothetical protein